jgi:hypothetical protein
MNNEIKEQWNVATAYTDNTDLNSRERMYCEVLIKARFEVRFDDIYIYACEDKSIFRRSRSDLILS